MLKAKIVISVCVSVLAMFVFEKILNGLFFPVDPSSGAVSYILKYFAPSVIAAVFVAIPFALKYRPGSLKLCLTIVGIWLALDAYLHGGNINTAVNSPESLSFLSAVYGPKLSAAVIFFLAGYIADYKLVAR